jgi:dedicator of cytokinesis protein 6/7/8
VKTRLRVIKREQWVLAPIEVALEDVQKRSRELGWAMAARPIDVKMLQMILQGCIGTTVNQGPLEVGMVINWPKICFFLKIARVFLAGVPLHSDGLPRDGPQRRLHLAFDELAQKCSDALEMNGQLMEPSREDYQVILKGKNEFLIN